MMSPEHLEVMRRLDTGKPVVCYVSHRSVDEVLSRKKMALITSYDVSSRVGTVYFESANCTYIYAEAVPLAEIAGFSEMQAEIDRLKAQLEQIDTVRSGWIGCNPNVEPNQ